MEMEVLATESLGEKLISFEANGHPSLKGFVIVVRTHFKKGYTPYLILMHCMAHQTSLVSSSLSNLSIVAKLEDLVIQAYNFFANSPKRHLELYSLATLVETKGLKLVKNKTCLMCILPSLKWALMSLNYLIKFSQCREYFTLLTTCMAAIKMCHQNVQTKDLLLHWLRNCIWALELLGLSQLFGLRTF